MSKTKTKQGKGYRNTSLGIYFCIVFIINIFLIFILGQLYLWDMGKRTILFSKFLHEDSTSRTNEVYHDVANRKSYKIETKRKFGNAF